MSEPLRLVCIDTQALPLFRTTGDNRIREGYEVDAAAAVADRMGRHVEWVFAPWVDMIPSVQRHDVDAVWCGQGMTAERSSQVDFTRPYAVFDESVLIRRGDAIASAADLAGRRVAAIANSTNMALAETFPGAVCVPFGGDTEDVFGDMIAALAAEDVDAVVDDDVALIPVADDPRFAIAFVVETGNRWGVGVAKDRPELLAQLDSGLRDVIADGTLARIWRQWMPELPLPDAISP